jgi:hypothetical protein
LLILSLKHIIILKEFILRLQQKKNLIIKFHFRFLLYLLLPELPLEDDEPEEDPDELLPPREAEAPDLDEKDPPDDRLTLPEEEERLEDLLTLPDLDEDELLEGVLILADLEDELLEGELIPADLEDELLEGVLILADLEDELLEGELIPADLEDEFL